MLQTLYVHMFHSVEGKRNAIVICIILLLTDDLQMITSMHELL